MNCVPTSKVAEIHLTYRCDLGCVNCNRLCNRPPRTADMTIADCEYFVRQCGELDWQPRIFLMGGEPTLHPDLLAIVDLFHAAGFRVTVTSNQFSAGSKALIAKIREEGKAAIGDYGWKRFGRIIQPEWGYRVAPVDFGVGVRQPCSIHSSRSPTCGISVDHDGYTTCCIGGAIDAWLGLGLRTRRLADLFDEEKALLQTRRLCMYCGHGMGADAGHIAKCQIVDGVLLSPTWQRALAQPAAAPEAPEPSAAKASKPARPHVAGDVYGVFYTHHKVADAIMAASLASIRAAGLPDERLIIVAHRPDDRFPSAARLIIKDTSHWFQDSPKLAYRVAVYEQMEAGLLAVPQTGVACFLEHDVLYPPDYFSGVAKQVDDDKLIYFWVNIKHLDAYKKDACDCFWSMNKNGTYTFCSGMSGYRDALLAAVQAKLRRCQQTPDDPGQYEPDEGRGVPLAIHPEETGAIVDVRHGRNTTVGGETGPPVRQWTSLPGWGRAAELRRRLMDEDWLRADPSMSGATDG